MYPTEALAYAVQTHLAGLTGQRCFCSGQFSCKKYVVKYCLFCIAGKYNFKKSFTLYI